MMSYVEVYLDGSRALLRSESGDDARPRMWRQGQVRGHGTCDAAGITIGICVLHGVVGWVLLGVGCCGVGEGVQLRIQHRFTTTSIRLPITRRFLYLAIYLLRCLRGPCHYRQVHRQQA